MVSLTLPDLNLMNFLVQSMLKAMASFVVHPSNAFKTFPLRKWTIALQNTLRA